MERDRFAFAWHLLLSAALISAVRSQIPLPKHPLGFVYHGGESSAPIHLTAFVDLTCPDSKQAWPTVKKVADMYGPKAVQFTLQLFPLPYHTNAFIAAQVSLRFDLKSRSCQITIDAQKIYVPSAYTSLLGSYVHGIFLWMKQFPWRYLPTLR